MSRVRIFAKDINESFDELSTRKGIRTFLQD